MSIKLMTKVFETDIESSLKFVLLAMSDYASDDGQSVYPSVDSLSRKTSLSERTVQRGIQTLIDKGWVTMVEEGGGRSNTNLYRINQDQFVYLPPQEHKHKHIKGDTMTQKGDIQAKKGDTMTVKGDTMTPDPLLTISNTSFNHIPEPIREECDMDGITESMNLGYGLKKKKSYLTEEEKQLAEVFSSIAGVKVPVSVTKRDYGEYTVTWWKPIREMLRQVDNDVARAGRLIEQAIEKQRKAGLPVGMPKSILNSFMGELSMNSRRMAKDADGNWREV